MGFQCTSREQGGVTIIEARGRLTLGEGRTMVRDTVILLVHKGHKKFLLNLAAVDFIDSYGIGELVRSQVAVRKEGGDLKLLNVQKRVLDLLHMTKLHTVFDIHTDEQVALRAFPSV